MNKTLITIFTTLLLIGCSSTSQQADVIHSAIMAANNGNYEVAESHLVEAGMTSFSVDGDGKKQTREKWNKITANRTVESLDIKLQKESELPPRAFFDVVIHYKDGSTAEIESLAVMQISDEWKMSFFEFKQ